MEPALKEQVLAVSELANHKGWKFIQVFATQQAELAMNDAASEDSTANVCRAVGKIQGLKRILTFVDSMVEQRKDI